VDDSIPRSIFLIAALILAGGFFAGAETAFSYCNEVRIKLLAESGNKKAKRVVFITANYERTVITLLIAINIIHVAAASLATITAISLIGGAGSAVASVILTIAVFLFSENIPKNIARVNADIFSLYVSLPIIWIIYVLWPFSTLFMVLGRAVKRVFKAKEELPSLTEDEFADIVESAGDDGLIDPEETQIIKAAISFGDLTVDKVMMGREQISAIPINISQSSLKDILLTEKYSRFPVYDGNIDHIVGVLQAALCLWKIVKGVSFRMREVLAKPYFVFPDTLIGEVFEEMGRKRTHFAIVRSREGKTIGIITMEDILEELVGEIYDEDDDQTAECEGGKL